MLVSENRIRFVLVFCLSIGYKISFSQCTPCNNPAPVGIIDYNSARISILSGANLTFNFLKLDDFESGKTLSDATILGISICNCASSGEEANSNITNWDLFFDTDDADFNGSGTGNTIPLCFLEASAGINNGFLGGTTSNLNTRQPLTPQGTIGSVPIASGGDGVSTIVDRFWDTDQLKISYYFAVPPTNATCTGLGESFPLINSNKSADYYSVSAAFTIVPRCTPCLDPSYN